MASHLRQLGAVTFEPLFVDEDEVADVLAILGFLAQRHLEAQEVDGVRRQLDEMLEVEGVDVFFVGPGDLSQAMGHPAAVPPGGKRAPEVVEKVEFITKKIKAAGKIAGTLVTEDDVEHWTKAGMQFLYIHTDPFLRAGINRIKKIIKVT